MPQTRAILSSMRLNFLSIPDRTMGWMQFMILTLANRNVQAVTAERA